MLARRSPPASALVATFPTLVQRSMSIQTTVPILPRVPRAISHASVLTLLGLLLAGAFGQALAHGDRPHGVRFVNGRWFDGSAFVARESVLVFEGRFVTKPPAEVETVDLQGGYAVPAFADAHSHAFSDSSDVDVFMRRFLLAGVYFSKNPNNQGRQVASVRQRLAREKRVEVVFANGGLTSPGGHPVQIYEGSGHGPAVDSGERRFAGDAYFEVADATALDKAWPRVLAGRPDFLKVYLEESEQHAARRLDAAFYGRRGLDPKLVPDIVRRAHAAKLTVSAHVTSAADFRSAVAAGVDEITHLPMALLTADDARETARRGITVVTTSVSHKPAPAAIGEIHRKNLALLKAANVKLALGTDHPTLNVIDEAENLLRIGAFDRAELLQLLCVATPRMVFPKRTVGSLAPGAEASFVVLAADPLRDLAALRNITLRVKDGVTLPPPEPTKPGIADALVPDLMRGDVGAAFATYDRLKATRPDSLDFSEQQLNGLGYGLLKHGQTKMAVAIFEKNVALFPESANAYDSLADGHVAAGDSTAARAAWRGVLKAIERKPPRRPETRQALEQRARAGLAGGAP